jgi:hypothetical protein
MAAVVFSAATAAVTAEAMSVLLIMQNSPS